MHLILHQFKTDWRHFWVGLLLLWALFAAQLILASPFIDGDAASGLQVLLLMLQSFTGAWLLARIIQADALVGSSAQWLTRPVRRPHLFWSKTVFIVLCLLLPRLVPQMIVCFWHHYSFDLFAASIAEALLYSLAVVLFISVLAALTPDLPRFFLLVGVALAVFFIWVAILVFFYRHAPGRMGSLGASANTMAFLFFCACALFVWVWQVLTGRVAPGLVVLGLGLLVLPWTMIHWNWDFLVARVHPLPPLVITTLNRPDSLSDSSDGQTLWSEFLVLGLPPHTVVVAEETTGSFDPNGQKQPLRLPFPGASYRPRPGRQEAVISRILPMNSSQKTAYLAAIHGWFPAETLWAGEQVNYWGGFPIPTDIFKKYTNRPVIGDIHCHLELDQFKVEEARLPLHPGAWTIGPGQRVVIHGLEHTQGGIQVELEEILATPMFSRSEYLAAPLTGSPQMPQMPQSFCTYVLYQPDWGEADVLETHSYSYGQAEVLTGETRRTLRYILPYPVLQERLAGGSRQNFLANATLCVFVPVYQGTIRQSFEATNFNLSTIHSSSPNDSDDRKNEEIVAQTVLPASPTAAQLSEYLDTLLWHLPENSSGPERAKIQRRLEAIGPAGIRLLLARLPLDSQAERDYVFPLLTKLATRDQLPELRAALGRDMLLADWFHQMNWDNDARDIVVAKLSDHRVEFTVSALFIAASAKDPATYPDLAWHFARLPYQSVASVLAKCPGFDLPAAVREAWSRWQLGLLSGVQSDLFLLAAKQGLPGALDQAILCLEQIPVSPIELQNQALQITALTDFSGAPDTALNWLSANLGHFTFDDATHRYLSLGMTNSK